MLCPSCDTQNRENARFCKGCGLSFMPQQEVTPTSQEQAQPLPLANLVETASAGITQPAAVSPTSVSPPEVPAATVEEQIVEVVAAQDISLAPTQILTPERMVAFQAKRWQEEIEQEKQQSPGEAAEELRKQAIADAPTLLFSLSESATSTQQGEEVDVASQPTIFMPLGEQELPTLEATIPAFPVPDVSTAPTKDGEEAEPAENQQQTTAADNAEVSLTSTVITQTAQEEDRMEQEQDQPFAETTEAQASTAFPTLAESTLVAERYEVTQILSESQGEHIYQVTDQQGYKHCWNCGSEQNAEGDEFCIDCGAELNNAVYIMHEYDGTNSASHETNVLQGIVVNTFVNQEHTYVVEQPQTTQSAFLTGVHLIAASDSDAGDVRRSEPNEDSTLVLHLQRVHESLATPAGIFLVADGMGGHDKGQVASRMTVNVIAEHIIRELLALPLHEEQAGKVQERNEESYVALLRGAVEGANTALCQSNQSNKSDMGSTLTGFMVAGDYAFIFNVGDSRTYMLRDGNLYQLTNDHSLVGQLVAGGLIEPDDVYTHPQRNQIYRSIGDKPNVQIDIFKQQVHPGDILLSCSDGLWEMVRDPQIATILNSAPDPQAASTQLLEAANTNGGEDNVSAVVVFVR